MNPQFEQKVTDNLETAVYNPNIVVKPSPQAQINRNFNRKLTLIFVFAIVCFASLIIIRGVLLQNPALYDNSSIIGQILNPNGATGLNGLNLTEAQTIINDFTTNLKNEYQAIPDVNSRVLLLKTTTTSTLGKLEKNEKFTKLADIANIIEMYRFYDDQTYLYAINTPNISLSELYLNTPNNKPVLIKRLAKNQKFIDAHFSISDKTFYYSYFDENNTVYIQATDLKGIDYQLYQTNFLTAKTKIWNVDATSGYVYLNQERECFALMLRDKRLDSYACEKIKTNNSSNFYWTNDSTTGYYSSFTKGEIYKFTYGELERKLLASKDNGQMIQNPWLSGDNLYYISGDLVSAGSSIWRFEPKDIQFINVQSTDTSTFGLKNMRSDIHSILPLDNLYIITQEFFGKNTLYKYVANPKFPEPVSYPSSYVVSGPVSYAEPINEQDYYWQSVDLKINYDLIEVIQPQYTYNL